MAVSRICSVEGCDKPARRRGWCDMHYGRWWRHGGSESKRPTYGKLEAFFREVVLPYQGDECLIWPFGRTVGGYGQMNRGKAKLLVHREVCVAIHGPPPPGQHARHTCGRGRDGCVSPRHIVWGTRSQNMADRSEHGTHQFGERNAQARLSAKDIRQIKALRGEFSQRELARRFVVTQSAISMIQAGKRWKPPT